MRLVTTVVVVTSILLLTCTYVHGSNLYDSPTSLAALQAKADQAQPRDRCFLYAELIKRMTDLAGQQFNSGDFEHALETLKLVQWDAEKIHSDVAKDSKKLKNAELLVGAPPFFSNTSSTKLRMKTGRFWRRRCRNWIRFRRSS